MNPVYSQLTPEERKVLEEYHKKASARQPRTTPSVSKYPKAGPKSSKPLGSSKSQILTSSSQKFQSRSPSTSSTWQGAPKYNSKADEKPNIKYEIERLLRSLYRHCIACPELKEELKAIGGIALLDEYLKYRNLKFS